MKEDERIQVVSAVPRPQNKAALEGSIYGEALQERPTAATVSLAAGGSQNEEEAAAEATASSQDARE